MLLVYFVGVTASMDGLELAMQGLRYSTLIVLFLLGVCVCSMEFGSFVAVIVRDVVLCALLSATHYLLGLAYSGETQP